MQRKLSWLSKPKTQSLIAFSVSTVIHFGICLTLAFILISTLGESGKSLKLAMVSTDETDAINELDFTVDSNSVSADVPFDSKIELSALSRDIATPSFAIASSIGRTDSLDDAAAQAAQAARAVGADEVVDHKSKTRASFFGAEADGNRFVFVIDSSGSMRGPRWEALCKELVRAIKSLSPDQEFFVLSFDSMAHPMFGLAPPKGKFLKAVDKNLERIRNWLRSIQHGSQTLPSSAVGIAMKLEPDAIFLLSDGEINDSTVEDLRIWNRKKDEEGNVKTLVPIHTVLLHSPMGFATLETIARENGGTFTPVRAR